MRKVLIAANWKMYKTIAEVEGFMRTLNAKPLPQDREYVIAASATVLHTLSLAAKETSIQVAAQNMYCEDEGAFTGEISPRQIKDAGATHVIIGHSERRQLFHEDNALLNKKMVAAQTHGITPIYCVGETAQQREQGSAQASVLKQLQEGIAGISPEFLQQCVIAYEPVWAIGTGKTATPEQAEEMHAFLREHLPEETRIIYGGSVHPEQAQALRRQPSIDGFLVGGASLDAETFFHIATIA